MYAYRCQIETNPKKFDSQRFKTLLRNGLERNLIYGDFPQYFRYAEILSIINEYSVKLIGDQIDLENNNANRFQIVRSSNDSIKPGIYACIISDNEQIQIYPTFQKIECEGAQYIVLNDYSNFQRNKLILSQDTVT